MKTKSIAARRLGKRWVSMNWLALQYTHRKQAKKLKRRKP